MEEQVDVHSFISKVAGAALPRILTQICRDPHSPSYGCCDRDWWHYRIRDFPSIILQQAGYAIALAGRRSDPWLAAGDFRALAAQTCRFWNTRSQRHGAFEEYYPFEQGYPPLAFSTLAVAKLCRDGVVAIGEVEPGLRVAARQLLSRFESKAANQQVAGTAALALLRNLLPDAVSDERFSTILDRTLALQTREGWFPEYDGPDLGYLSVTIDCLWDIYDSTGDDRCRAAIAAAANYIAWFVLGPLGGAGMHNARNTDYIVPYGLVRLACTGEKESALASEVVTALYGRHSIEHFLNAVDDRYWCHYIGHSVFRAADVLGSSTPAAHRVAVAPRPDRMSESGHFSLGPDGSSGPYVLVSARKGGIFTALWPQGQRAADFGWIVESGRRSWHSHWWSTDWKIFRGQDEVSCEGALVAHNEYASTPLKHVALRIASFLLGRRLIAILKQVLIFKPSRKDYGFSRRIRCEGDTVIVEDRISGLKSGDRLVSAPRASKRHVASADAFHPEDLQLLMNVSATVEKSGTASEQRIVTYYRPQTPASAQKTAMSVASGH